MGVRRHVGARERRSAVASQRHALCAGADLLHRQASADHAGAADDDVPFVDQQLRRREARHLSRVAKPRRAGSDVRTPGVDDDRLRTAVAEMLLRHLHGPCPNCIAREHRRRDARPIRREHPDIERVLARRLDARVYAARREPLGRGHATPRDNLDARGRGRRLDHYGNSPSACSPAVSGSPNITFMHWTTLPAAPFPRLSIAAVTTICPVCRFSDGCTIV